MSNIQFSNSRKFSFSGFLSLLWILMAGSSGAQLYTLEEAVKIALENNKLVLNDQLSSREALLQIGESKSAMLPHVDLTNQYQYYLDMPAQYAPASAFGGPEGEYSKLSLNMKQTMGTSLQVSQAIINREASSRIKLSEISYEASLVQTELTKESVAYNITATYFTIQVLTDNLQRLAENIANLERTVSVNEVLLTNEIIAENIHSRLNINLQNLRNEYENQQLYLSNQLSALKNLMNLHSTASLSVTPFDDSASGLDLIQNDLMRRPDLRLQKSFISLEEYKMKNVQARYSPVITAGFSAGFTGYYDSFAPTKQINNDWIGSSAVTIQAKIPLFSGFGKKFEMAQQNVAIQKARNSFSMMALRAEKELWEANQNYATHQTQLLNTKKSLDLAQHLFDSAQNDYGQGISTITELLDAQNDLTNARTNYSNALLNLKLTELSIRKATGLL